MEREIKFRAWAKEAKVMHPEWLKLDDEGGKYVLMQYIGLKDKNGKEIYEGDILTVPNDNYRPDNGAAPLELCQVEYKNGGFRTPEIAFSEVLDEWFCKNETEVIGNIYENPDLLTTNNK